MAFSQLDYLQFTSYFKPRPVFQYDQHLKTHFKRFFNTGKTTPTCIQMALHMRVKQSKIQASKIRMQFTTTRTSISSPFCHFASIFQKKAVITNDFHKTLKKNASHKKTTSSNHSSHVIQIICQFLSRNQTSLKMKQS